MIGSLEEAVIWIALDRRWISGNSDKSHPRLRARNNVSPAFRSIRGIIFIRDVYPCHFMLNDWVDRGILVSRFSIVPWIFRCDDWGVRGISPCEVPWVRIEYWGLVMKATRAVGRGTMFLSAIRRILTMSRPIFGISRKWSRTPLSFSDRFRLQDVRLSFTFGRLDNDGHNR